MSSPRCEHLKYVVYFFHIIGKSELSTLQREETSGFSIPDNTSHHPPLCLSSSNNFHSIPVRRSQLVVVHAIVFLINSLNVHITLPVMSEIRYLPNLYFDI